MTHTDRMVVMHAMRTTDNQGRHTTYTIPARRERGMERDGGQPEARYKMAALQRFSRPATRTIPTRADDSADRRGGQQQQLSK